MPKRFTIAYKQYLAQQAKPYVYKMEFFIIQDKTTSFVESYN